MQRCTGCHGRKADGNGPNSIDMSPRPRNLRNSAFINATSDHRLLESVTYGVEGTAMPSWMDYGLQPERHRRHRELHPQFERNANEVTGNRG